MIKVLLGFVAFIVVLLTAYMFSNKPNETVKKETITKVEKKDVSEEQVEVPEVKEVKTPKKVISVAKSPKVVSRKSTQEMKEEIGEGLTPESIENTDISDEEKERMRNDLIFHQSQNIEFSEPLNNKEIEEMIIDDLKSGQI
jgi:hypothetical protein